MSAVWMRVRAEMRGRWRAWLGLALVVGVAGGAAIAAAAGARRTESAYPRFLRAQRAMDVVVSPEGEGDPQKVLDAVRRLPQVADSAVVTIVEAPIVTAPRASEPFFDLFPLVDPEGRFGVSLNRMKILSGRLPNPERADEVAASLFVARRLRLRVGARIEMLTAEPGQDAPEGQPPSIPLRVVGIGIEPGTFQPLAGSYIPAIHLTPAFYRAHRALIPPEEAGLVVRFRRGPADLRAFEEELRRRGLNVTVDFNLAGQTEGVQRSTRYQAVALWALAGLVALTALAVLGQAFARQTFLESTEYPTLRALGMAPGQLWAVGIIRAAVTGAAGAALAVAIAYGASPLTPTGIARLAELHPGLAFDAVAAGAGVAATVVLVALVSVLPTWRAARARGGALEAVEATARRPSAVAAVLGRAGLPPTAVAGARMALEPGRGRTAVPVRTTILGTTVGILALAAAVTFSGSVQNLLETPRLSGYTWDAIVGVEGPGPAKLERALRADRTVEAVSRGDLPQLEINGRPMLGFVFESGPRAVVPAIIEGRVPVAADEITLGPRTFRDLGVRIGSTVDVVASADEGGRPVPSKPGRMRVVGKHAVPTIFFDPEGSGSGGAMTLDALRTLRPASAAVEAFLVRFADGVNAEERLAALRREIGDLFILPRQESGDVADLRGVSNAPVALAGILAAMAAATLAHTLVSSIRRRSRDLAILKTLGFVRRQVSAAVAWQASILALVALAVGLPLGVAAGRWAWRAFAGTLGVVPEVLVPLWAIALAVPGMLALANLIAALPARAAARTRPAAVLRTE